MTSKRYALLAAIVSSSLVGLDGIMTPLALPVIAQDMGVGLAVQQWLAAAFLLPLGSLLLLGGALGDVYDRWLVFGVGTAGFGAAALLCALAPSPAVLIAGRLVQGAAAALMVPGALAVIVTTFEGEQRSRAIATWTAWSGLSVIVGPLLAGMLIEAGSWRYLYGVLVPLAVVGSALIMRAAPAQRRRRASGSIDCGALLGVPAVGGPAFALIQGPALGWGSPLIIVGIAVGLVCGAVFLWWEGHTAHPLLPLKLFRIRTFAVLNAATFLLYGGLICSGFYTILFLQQTAGYSPMAAGLAAAVPMGVLLLLAGRTGALADRFGFRWFIAAGSLLMGAGTLLLLRTDAEADFGTVVFPAVLVQGIGLTMLVPPLTAAVLNAAGEQLAGLASGVNNAVARIGSLLGVAMVGIVISAQFAASLERQAPSLPAAVVERARDRPLSVAPAGELSAAERDRARQALQEASVDAFRLGTGVLAALAITAGFLAAAGIGRRQPLAANLAGYPADGCPGGALHGAHRDLTKLSRAAHTE